MENYVDNRGNRFYLSPGTIASLGLPWTGDPTGFTPPPSWDYGAFFNASCNAAMMNFAKQEFENYLKRVQGDRQDENKIAQKYGLNTVTLMLNLTVPLDNKWYYHDPNDKGDGGSQKKGGSSTTERMLDKSGKVSTSLDLVSFSSYISGAPRLGAKVGLLGTAVGVVSLGNDVHKLSQNKISTSRFSFHVAGFAASLVTDLTIGSEVGGPYGAAAGAGVGLTFGAAELYYDNVVVPYIEKPFNSSFNSFMRSYFNIPSF